MRDVVNSSFDKEKNAFNINKVLNKTGDSENVILDGGFLISPIEEFTLYKTSSNNLISLLLLLVFIIIFMIYKNSKKNKTILSDKHFEHNKSIYNFDFEDLSVLKQLIIQKEMNFNDVMDIYQNPSLSYGHNTRLCNEKSEKLSIRLKSILKLDNQVIQKKKSNVDRRQNLIYLSEEFRIIKIIIK